MQAIRHLLCPVDLSEPAGQALRYAARLRSLVNGTLTIVHVRARDARRPDLKESPDIELETFVSGLIGVEPAVRFLERHGDPVTEILGTVAGAAFDIIVMATHGRTGLQRLLGSVTERVIRRSPTPVLTVPYGPMKEAHGAIRLQTVLCAVDFSEPSARAVGYGASIATAVQARLVLAHVLEWSEELEATRADASRSLPSSEDDAVARMSELLTDEVRRGSAPEFVVVHGQPADEVIRIVYERQVDVVVLGIRRRNPIDLAVFGSTAQRLIREGACTVLTVRGL
jgi:nucleotide-binding universal stress UspA family protein